MDDVTRAWFEMRFQVAFAWKLGTEFQDFFADIMEKAYLGDFQRIRPYGRQGDFKCDGFHTSTGTVFQVYAPYQIDMSTLLAKIDEDFHGALAHWKGRMRTWVFVHNDRRGLPAPIVQALQDLQAEHPSIRIGTWSYEDLRRVVVSMPEAELAPLFGPALSRRHVENLGFEKLKPVLLSIRRQEGFGDGHIEPVSPDKLAANAISANAAYLLKVGRHKDRLVADFLSQWPDPTLAEQIAEAFRQEYQALRRTMLTPDEIFARLQAFAGGNGRGDPDHEAAVLAVMAYFFERCDIFEDPKRPTAP